MDVIVRHADSVKIIELAGSLDWSSAAGLRQTLIDAITGPPLGYVVVNLREVYFMDSSGLSALVVGLKHARESGGNLSLCSLQSPVRMIFELTRFDKVFEIFVSEEDAVFAAVNQN